jgi:hypothetical protein
MFKTSLLEFAFVIDLGGNEIEGMERIFSCLLPTPPSKRNRVFCD